MNETDLLGVMSALDQGGTMFGALPAESRARLFAVIDDPTSDTWDNAYSVVVANRGFGGMTLWQALLRFTTYDVTRGPSSDQDGLQVTGWERIPTQAELVTALTEAVAN